MINNGEVPAFIDPLHNYHHIKNVPSYHRDSPKLHVLSQRTKQERLLSFFLFFWGIKPEFWDFPRYQLYSSFYSYVYMYVMYAIYIE